MTRDRLWINDTGRDEPSANQLSAEIVTSADLRELNESQHSVRSINACAVEVKRSQVTLSNCPLLPAAGRIE